MGTRIYNNAKNVQYIIYIMMCKLTHRFVAGIFIHPPVAMKFRCPLPGVLIIKLFVWSSWLCQLRLRRKLGTIHDSVLQESEEIAEEERSCFNFCCVRTGPNPTQTCVCVCVVKSPKPVYSFQSISIHLLIRVPWMRSNSAMP